MSFPLIRKQRTTLALGALLLIDPSSPTPVVPIINYYHKFSTTNIDLIVDLPTGINLKKQIFSNAWISAGSNQNSYTTFYKQEEGWLHGKTSYNTIEARNGLAFEYLMWKKLLLGVGAGINSTFSSRIFKNGEDFNSATVTSKHQSAPYVNFSLSILPFFSKK